MIITVPDAPLNEAYHVGSRDFMRIFCLTFGYNYVRMILQTGGVVMATETFFKRIILSDEAAEKLADGFDVPREPYVPKSDRAEVRRRKDEWLKRYLSQSEKS